jgi:hypothetical protein
VSTSPPVRRDPEYPRDGTASRSTRAAICYQSGLCGSLLQWSGKTTLGEYPLLARVTRYQTLASLLRGPERAADPSIYSLPASKEPQVQSPFERSLLLSHILERASRIQLRLTPSPRAYMHSLHPRAFFRGLSNPSLLVYTTDPMDGCNSVPMS